MRKSTVQDWVSELTLMQQAVLLSALRGPDGIVKDHISKRLVRWFRRCVLNVAFMGGPLPLPYDPPGLGWRGGSFTGPSCYCIETITDDPGRQPAGCVFYASDENRSAQAHSTWHSAMCEVAQDYMRTLDEIPHHFQLHFMHATEILGYKHPTRHIRDWWAWLYIAFANDMHLRPETEEEMDERLGDVEAQWRAREEVTAR